MFIFTWIGFGAVTIFFIRRRHWFMNRGAFFNQLRHVREWDRRIGFHKALDGLSEIVMGQSCDSCTEDKMEDDLEKDVIRVIKRIEEAKKTEKLKKKAIDLIETIKKSLEE